MKLYERIDGPEILSKDITIQNFPTIYIDEHDKVYCYLGVLDKERVVLQSSPYYIIGKKSIEAKKYIKGYFRIENGAIVEDSEYIDEKNIFNESAKYKIIDAYPHFPKPQDMSFGFTMHQNYELEDELTRKIFGLTHKELEELLYHFNKIFEITSTSIYNRYPSITRSIKSDNYCDISDLWIPAEFPYIAFEESSYWYSHVSLYAFYKHVQFITSHNIKSPISEKMIGNGLNKEVLENLFKMNNHMNYSSTLITRDYYFKLLDEREK